ncbi:acetyltransferase [Sediminicola sp. YIK13]|uniref:GNAT family N-acetyltransferase n=1 Tax=Sediminicola sp. YIK13 TaxID=1453352 RepID=UPI00071F8AA9|nr:GNAT family N-acetyltransferase [Sediminicola sp. YIK13]ALM06467.1 acetyltransferase [Sediminicola sp. YIK13]
MKNYTCRKATIDDLEILLKFEQGIIVAERPFDPTIKKDPVTYYDLREYILSDDIEVVVVETNGAVIASGYALIKKARPYLDHEEYAYLGFMYTHPDYRGQGVNQLVVKELKKWASAKGLKEIRLTVYNDNIPAIKAYERVGFKKHIIEMRLNTQ